MSAAAKYLIRQPAHDTPAEPERLTETDALRALVAASAGAACVVCEVGPVANHLRGPVAAVPPYGHPEHDGLTGTLHRTKQASDSLINDAAGIGPRSPVPQCSCDGLSKHHITVLIRHLSVGKVAVAHFNDERSQATIDAAIRSADVDRLIYELEPRLYALAALVDRARAEHGGDLPDLVTEATAVLAKTLTGPTRWNVREGYEKHEWRASWRVGVAFEKADSILKQDFIHDAVLRRLLDGR